MGFGKYPDPICVACVSAANCHDKPARHRRLSSVVAADEEAGIVVLPLPAGRFHRLQFVREHQQVDEVALQQFRIEQLLDSLLDQASRVPDRPVGVGAVGGGECHMMILGRLMEQVGKLLIESC